MWLAGYILKARECSVDTLNSVNIDRVWAAKANANMSDVEDGYSDLRYIPHGYKSNSLGSLTSETVGLYKQVLFPTTECISPISSLWRLAQYTENNPTRWSQATIFPTLTLSSPLVQASYQWPRAHYRSVCDHNLALLRRRHASSHPYLQSLLDTASHVQCLVVYKLSHSLKLPQTVAHPATR